MTDITTFNSPVAVALDYTVFAGTADEIVSSYRNLTGKVPLMPDWAFGYIQSKLGYDNESDATVAITKLQDQGFPVDALALDQHWYGGQNVRGNIDWDIKNWPNAAGMVKNLNDKGVKTPRGYNICK